MQFEIGSTGQKNNANTSTADVTCCATYTKLLSCKKRYDTYMNNAITEAMHVAKTDACTARELIHKQLDKDAQIRKKVSFDK